MISAASVFRSGARRLLAARRPLLARGIAAEAEAPKAAEKVAETTAKAAEASAGGSGGGGGSSIPLIIGLAGLGGGLYYAKEQGLLGDALGAPSAGSKPDYGAVRKAIADILDVEDYDDGSYGPLFVRLAWHASGTYDKTTGIGGSHGASMRFSPESEWGANAGLALARDLLEPIKAKFPSVSYADLWTLSGVVAIEEMGGPTIPWRPGRGDCLGAEGCPPKENLPDASKNAAHLRDVFYRMGFNDQEIVALSGAHTLGRCHTDRSGYVNPWSFAPTTFSNLYFTELKGNKWSKKKWKGPLQYEDKTGELMMLPTDMVLLWDRSFKKHVDVYAADQDKFFDDFAAAFSKLLELGVPFPEPEKAS